ncbi:MAG: hypothetical protein WBA01_05700 [Phormidesmis sp.]
MAIAYCTIFGVTLSIVLSALFKDHSADRRSLSTWLFVGVTALIWPITLPFIISSKLRAYRSRSQNHQRQTRQAEASGKGMSEGIDKAMGKGIDAIAKLNHP